MMMIMIHNFYKVFGSGYVYPSNMIVRYFRDLGTGVFSFFSVSPVPFINKVWVTRFPLN